MLDDRRRAIGITFIAVGLTSILGFGVAASTSNIQFWPNPWFVASVIVTLVGVALVFYQPPAPKPMVAVPTAQGPRSRFPDWQAGHKSRDDHVLVWIHSTNASTLGPVKCVVQDAKGVIYPNVFDQMEPHSRGRWEYVFPYSFVGAPEPIASGHYIVKWTAGVEDVEVVRDAFDVL